MDAQHIVTTYSFNAITAIFDLNCPGTDFGTVLMRLQLKKDQIVGQVVNDDKRTQLINSQLKHVLKLNPDLRLPFRCCEGWPGHGSKDHPIFQRMVESSKAPETWREFRHSMRVRTTSSRQSQ
jgi:hypothetical protein